MLLAAGQEAGRRSPNKGGASSVVEQRTRLITEAEAVKETPLQPVGQSARQGATKGSNPLGGATTPILFRSVQKYSSCMVLPH